MAKQISHNYTKIVKIDDYKKVLAELSVDLSIPKYATHLIYMTNSNRSDEIEENYNKLKQAMKSKDKKSIMSEYIRTNHANDILKMPTIVSETKLNIAAGNSVVIFVNYTDCLLTLSSSSFF